MKKNVRILAIVIACMLLISLTAFARAIPCDRCVSGRIITTTRLERVSFMTPCSRGYGGTKDVLIEDQNNTYSECNECHYGNLISSVYVSSTYFCEATGQYYSPD